MPIGKETVCYQEGDRAYPWRVQYMCWYSLKIVLYACMVLRSLL